ncbi:MAG: ion transporter [Deltaproteobacteria bacterium]|nr:ion transporter [Deltaproteobacteria bacterium]MBW2161995.1 ion transporter [Deltaproteobacteria bacterium]MBW2585368.1 ion transporter [Deltaproteobacteria bacterium]
MTLRIGTGHNGWVEAQPTDRTAFERFRAKTWGVLNGAEGTVLGRAVPLGIGTLILLNTLAVIASSHSNWSVQAVQRFDDFELFSVLVFAVEYVLRVWSSAEDPRYSRPILGRLRFMVTPLALVDLIAIVPAFIPAASVDLRTARVLRLVRIARILKLGRYSRSLRLFARVFARAWPEMVSCLIVLTVLLILGSSLMYFSERQAQPEAFPTITATLWWGVATLSTVGYGDVYPITALGKLVGSVVALLGIGFFALPAGIITSNYLHAVREMDAEEDTCPHCGQTMQTSPPT